MRMAHRFAWTGVESDATSAAIARRRLTESGVAHTLHVQAFEDAPLTPPYDALVAFEVLEHIEDDAAALRSWRELVAPGGMIVLSVPAWQDQFGPWDERVGHYRRYSPHALGQLLADTGWGDDIETSLYGFPLAFVLEAIRNALARRSTQKEADAATSESGRLLQPGSDGAGTATRVLTKPFRAFEATRDWQRLGTGLVVSARRAA